MPIYDYECKNEKCKHKFEQAFSSFSAYEAVKETLTCPACASKDIEKLMSTSTSFQLKGGGWHGSDYTKRGRR